MTPAPKSFPSAGKRLAAAMLSFRLGYTGVDRALKRFAGKPVDAWWEKQAQRLLRAMEKSNRDVKPRAQTPRM